MPQYVPNGENSTHNSSNVRDLVLLIPSEIIWELSELMVSLSQGVNWYKVPLVGINGKFNETMEVCASWSKRKKQLFELEALDMYHLRQCPGVCVKPLNISRHESESFYL